MGSSELLKWLESDEGEVAMEEFVKNLAFKEKIKQGRFDKFEKWLEKNDFDKLLYRLILEHNNEYIEKCYERGYEPYPTRKMQFVFDFVKERAGKKVHIKEFDSVFTNFIWEFKGYYFQITWGQGAFIQIYNKKDKKQIFGI